jgi:hypothetical protein
MARREQYTCAIARDADGRVVAITVEATDLEGVCRRTTVSGSRLPALVSPLRELLRERRVAGRSWTSPDPIELDQIAGAQTELLLRAVRPLRRGDRALAVAEAIAAMSREEASYWHAKAQRPGGLRALRVLLAGARS